jgi:hypothetical protein
LRMVRNVGDNRVTLVLAEFENSVVYVSNSVSGVSSDTKACRASSD